MKIYLQKDEDIFIKYGDEEAAFYEKMQKLDEEKRQKNKVDRDQGGKVERGDKQSR